MVEGGIEMETLSLGKRGGVLTDLDDDSPFEYKHELLSFMVVLHPLMLRPGVDRDQVAPQVFVRSRLAGG